jgi:hypothetical protein
MIMWVTESQALGASALRMALHLAGPESSLLACSTPQTSQRAYMLRLDEDALGKECSFEMSCIPPTPSQAGQGDAGRSVPPTLLSGNGC